jgi:rhodanese-related sulfurtransferase
MHNGKHLVEAREVRRRQDGNEPVLLLDVRTGPEFRERHIPGAVNVPLHRLDRATIRDLAAGGKPVCFICAAGGRAERAWRKAERAGLEQAFCLRGGMEAWRNEGLPVASGPPAFSLERQVRIAAGALVLVGLGAWLHPAGLALAAFVGAGLAFAGITNTCGMAQVLIRMPWNR